MSKERTDEFLKWRGLLDQPDAGLDQVLDDREATWQKLADRLGERRRNRRSGYRIAAACLLFVLIIPVFRLFQDRHNATGADQRGHYVDLLPANRARTADQGDRPTSTTAVRQQRAPNPSSDPLHPAASDPLRPAAPDPRPSRQADDATSTTDQLRSSRQANGAAIPPDQPRPAGQADGALTSRSPRREQETGWRAWAVKASARKMDRTLLAALIGIGSSPSSIMAAPPDPASQGRFPPSSPAKQLKVVHQNEIRGGNTPSPAVSATSSDRLIDLFRPSPQQPSSALPPAEEPALLKIKLSPSN